MRLKTETGIDPVEIAVDLDGKGCKLWVRPAETIEEMRAAESATVLLAGVLAGQAALIEVMAAFGQRFEAADFKDPLWQTAAAQAVTLLELATLCALRWENVEDETGTVLPEPPRREHLALLLRDPTIANKISAALRRRIAVEANEGNASAASPSGEAVIQTTAPDAASQDHPAPAG